MKGFDQEKVSTQQPLAESSYFSRASLMVDCSQGGGGIFPAEKGSGVKTILIPLTPANLTDQRFVGSACTTHQWLLRPKVRVMLY